MTTYDRFDFVPRNLRRDEALDWEPPWHWRLAQDDRFDFVTRKLQRDDADLSWEPRRHWRVAEDDLFVCEPTPRQRFFKRLVEDRRQRN
jgi:hypothetical protein